MFCILFRCWDVTVGRTNFLLSQADILVGDKWGAFISVNKQRKKVVSYIGFVLWCFIVLCRCYIFYKLEDLWQLLSSKSHGAIFPTALAHFMFLSHFVNFSYFKIFIIVIYVTVISDYNSLKVVCMFFLSHVYPFDPALFYLKYSPCSIIGASLVINQVSIHVWVWFWIVFFFTALLITLPMPLYLKYYSFIESWYLVV